MDVSCPAQGKCQAKNSLSPKNSSRQEHESDTKHMNSEAEETMCITSDSVNIKQLRQSPENATDFGTRSRSDSMTQVAAKSSSRSTQKGKKVSSKLGGKNYMLRSSAEGARVLTSRTNEACKTPPTSTSTNLISDNIEKRRKRKKREKINRAADNELSRIKKRFSYLSTRISFEQRLIEAYSGEGWKRQSIEKVRPEMELQRASSEILRCKLEMRDLFHRLDTLCSEGKLQESLFDPEGQIDSEDIFCAKCGSKDVSLKNDIILCDGGCDRGFHQLCLVPPLLKIPPGDEGWLCPECDCKADCINRLNEIQGTDLSIDDKWEKVFPEAATIAAGDKQYDDLGLPSDDSEDNDYDPDGPEPEEKRENESSSSEESDSNSMSDVSGASPVDKQCGNSGFSSDDAEDNDYDPDASESDVKDQNEGSSSDESDFSSDTNDLIPSNSDNESLGLDELHASSSLNHGGPVCGFDEESCKISPKMRRSLNPEEHSILEKDLSGEDALPISGKRFRQQLDYKKLYDETYGNISSASSDDEDWADNNKPNKGRKICGRDAGISSMENVQPILKGMNSKPSQIKLEQEIPVKNKDRCRKVEKTPDTSNYFNMESKGTDNNQMLHSTGNKVTTSGPRRYGREVSQRLCESWKISSCPTQESKENLSKELGITTHQVSKWFENTHRSLHLSATKEASETENNSLNKDNVLTTTSGKEPVSEAKLFTVGLASNEGEDMHTQPINPSTQHVTPNSKGRRREAGNTPLKWNSAKYESRKRRQAKLQNQAQNETFPSNEKPKKSRQN